MIEVQTEFGRFRRVNAGAFDDPDSWNFQCPGCGQWAYLDDDQFHGRVSINHAADGCAGGYHETHDFHAALEATVFKGPEEERE